MKNIDCLKAKRTIMFEDGNNLLLLVEGESVVTVVPHNPLCKKEIKGLVTSANEEGIKIDNGDFISYKSIYEITKWS